jgi:hypothetical protein
VPQRRLILKGSTVLCVFSAHSALKTPDLSDKEKWKKFNIVNQWLTVKKSKFVALKRTSQEIKQVSLPTNRNVQHYFQYVDGF